MRWDPQTTVQPAKHHSRASLSDHVTDRCPQVSRLRIPWSHSRSLDDVAKALCEDDIAHLIASSSSTPALASAIASSVSCVRADIGSDLWVDGQRHTDAGESPHGLRPCGHSSQTLRSMVRYAPEVAAPPLVYPRTSHRTLESQCSSTRFARRCVHSSGTCSGRRPPQGISRGAPR